MLLIQLLLPVFQSSLPANVYLFKVNNRNIRKRCGICLKLTTKTPERRQWLGSGVFITKDAVSGLKQLLATESPLKVIKNYFYFTLKALFVLKIFNFFSWLFSYVVKQSFKRQTSDTSSDNEWQQVTASGTTSDNKWKWVTRNANEWQRVVILANFPFFRIKEEATVVAHNCHGKKNKTTTKWLKSRQHEQSHGKIKKTHGRIKKATAK